MLTRRRGSQQNLGVNITNLAESSFNSSGDESEDGATLSSPGSFCPLLTEGTTSAGEWVGVTTNSEECSYSSEIDGSDNQIAVTSDNNDHPFAWEMEMVRRSAIDSKKLRMRVHLNVSLFRCRTLCSVRVVHLLAKVWKYFRLPF